MKQLTIRLRSQASKLLVITTNLISISLATFANLAICVLLKALLANAPAIFY